MHQVAMDCFYSLSSPWAYLGGPQLEDIVRRYHVKLVLKPYDFQAVVPHTGGIPLKTRPEARRSYHALELARWRDYLGLPLNLEPAHYPKGVAADPNWNKYAGWMVIAAQNLHEAGQGPHPFALSHALLRALWAEERDTSQAEVRVAVADENGYDGKRLRALEQASTTQASYRAFSDEAISTGVFGAPTFVIDGERFWGQDRLLFVERTLAKASHTHAAQA
jgi:2-hydroxychromene-2-carboxylate isomerase